MGRVKTYGRAERKKSAEERQKFYEETRKAYAVVSTSETRPFGCFIFTKGVIKPDGSVWVLDKN